MTTEPWLEHDERYRRSAEFHEATGDRKGMWAGSTFEDLVQYNDGFRTQLIGTPEQIAERIVARA